MAANIGIVSLDGIFHEDSMITFAISGTVTSADVGKAVTLDATAANTVKLAGDNDEILGRLEVCEDRQNEGTKICTVAMRGSFAFPVNPNATASPDEVPAKGDYICGATTNASAKGYVQQIASSGSPAKRWLVVDTFTENSVNYAVAIKV